MESSNNGALSDEDFCAEASGDLIKAIGGVTDVEGILSQQLKALQGIVSETQRAHSLAGGRNRLLRKAQAELAELQVENRQLKRQLEKAGLVPEVKGIGGSVEKGSFDGQPMKAWAPSDNVQSLIPGAIEEIGSNVGTDKKLMPSVFDPPAPSLKLAPLLPMEEDSMKRITAAEIREAESKLHEDIQKAASVGLTTPPPMPCALPMKVLSTPSADGRESDWSELATQETPTNLESPGTRVSGSRASRMRPSARMNYNLHSEEKKSAELDQAHHSADKDKKEGGGPKAAVFADAAALKEKLRLDMSKPPYDVKNFYHTEGCAQKVARSHLFENATLTVIGFNALWIWIDTDYNTADILLDADPLFIIMENFFCTYFSMEWLFRYFSFVNKWNCLRDTWFIFDSTLVTLMVCETWIMTLIIALMGGGGGSVLGNASILKLVRLMRLSRMARMARLLRAMPELMVLIKGMVVAMRSVFFTLILLAGIIYIFGIAFVQLLKDTDVGDELFKNVFMAMDSLLLQGVLPDEMTLIEECAREGWVYKTVALVYILLAGLTVMNMLVGVLCEVVSVVSSVEKESLLVNYVKGTLQHMLATSGIDVDGDQRIAKNEFGSLLQFEGAAKAIQEVGVDVVGLMDFTDFIFKDGKALSFPEFMDMILQLRGTNTATVKDIVDLRRYVTIELDMMDQRICDFITKEIKEAVASATPKAVPMNPALQMESYCKSDNDPNMAWAASAASRLCVAASELSVAATELGCRQRLKRKNLDVPALEDT